MTIDAKQAEADAGEDHAEGQARTDEAGHQAPGSAGPLRMPRIIEEILQAAEEFPASKAAGVIAAILARADIMHAGGSDDTRKAVVIYGDDMTLVTGNGKFMGWPDAQQEPHAA